MFKMRKPVFIPFLLTFFCTMMVQGSSFASDVFVKERVQIGKSIRTRMPPQILIETLQKDFDIMSPKLSTFWTNFVVEDDQVKEEFLIMARSVEKNWAFSKLREECPEPENYEKLKADVESKTGTPVRINVLVGISKSRSWFRYTIKVYEPMFLYWTNPCYEWNMPPTPSANLFYSKNYTMRVYAKNLGQDVYDLVKDFNKWKPPKKTKKIPAIRGPGQEIIGGDLDLLTDEEKKLSANKQEELIGQRKEEKIEKKKVKEANK